MSQWDNTDENMQLVYNTHQGLFEVLLVMLAYYITVYEVYSIWISSLRYVW